MIYLWIGLYVLSYVLAYIVLRLLAKADNAPWTKGDRNASLLLSVLGPAVVSAGILVGILALLVFIFTKLTSNNEPSKW